MHVTLARALSPLVWRSPRHAAATFFSFAQTEAASEIDLRQAAALTSSPSRRALYLTHALDEARHTRLFARKSAELRRSLDLPALGYPLAAPEALYHHLGEPRFLAFVYRGERRGRQQFEGYRDYFARCHDHRTVALFDAVLPDERRHEAYCYELLVAVAGGLPSARRALRYVAWWEAWRQWRRLARSLVHPLYTVLMLLLFATLAPFALLVRVARPAKTGWITAPTRPAP